MWQGNSTQIAGLISFAAAATATGLAARSSVGSRRLWSRATIAYALMCAEVIVGTRHMISTAIGNLARDGGLYDERRPFQAVVIVIVLAIAWIAFAWAAARYRRQDWQLSASYTAIFTAVNVLVLEAVSLHAIDHILYSQIVGVMLVGWVWIAAGCVACVAAIAAIADRRS